MRTLLEVQGEVVESSKPAIQQLPIILGDWARHHDPGFHMDWHAMQWVVTIAAVIVVLINRTDWRADISKEILVPYFAVLLPNPLLSFCRGEPGRWIALIGLLVRLFAPDRYPSDFDMPLALLLLLIIAPSYVLDLKDSPAAILICILVALLFLYQHTANSNGVRRAFSEKHLLPASLLLLVMTIVPILMLITSFTQN